MEEGFSGMVSCFVFVSAGCRDAGRLPAATDARRRVFVLGSGLSLPER